MEGIKFPVGPRLFRESYIGILLRRVAQKIDTTRFCAMLPKILLEFAA